MQRKTRYNNNNRVSKPPCYYSLDFPSNIKFKNPRYLRAFSAYPKLKEILITVLKSARLYTFRKRRACNVLTFLKKIIPLEYFGTNKHRKLFFEIVNRILTRSAHECVYKQHLAEGYDSKKVPWLSEFQEEPTCANLIMKANAWLLENVVKPVIAARYKSVKLNNAHEYLLVRKEKWTHFTVKAFQHMLSLNYLVYNKGCENPIKVRGILRIIPKSGSYDYRNFRPLSRNIRKENPYKFRNMSRKIQAAARKICFVKTDNLYLNWKEYVEKIKETKLYGAKIDVRDAYGNINISKLHNILDSVYLNLSTQEKEFIKNYTENQLVFFKYWPKGWIVGSKKRHKEKPLVWQWKHGLLQGDRLSSSLCSLYMSYCDNMYLQVFNRGHCFIHRTVDDYFFCSPYEEEVSHFIYTMRDMYTINDEKTQSNIYEYDTGPKIEYCGQVFCLDTSVVRRSYSFAKNTSLRHKFKFWNAARPIPFDDEEQFLRRPMKFAYNNYNFKPIELNTNFNTEDVVLQNFFDGMVFLAFKFDALVMARYLTKPNLTLVQDILERLVYCYSLRSVQNLEKERGKYDQGNLTLTLFAKIGYCAFYVVLKRRYYVYQPILVDLKKKHKFHYVCTKSIKDLDNKYFRVLPPAFLNLCMKRTFKRDQ